MGQAPGWCPVTFPYWSCDRALLGTVGQGQGAVPNVCWYVKLNSILTRLPLKRLPQGTCSLRRQTGRVEKLGDSGRSRHAYCVYHDLILHKVVLKIEANIYIFIFIYIHRDIYIYNIGTCAFTLIIFKTRRRSKKRSMLQSLVSS